MTNESTTPVFDLDKELDAREQSLGETPPALPLLLLTMGGAGAFALVGYFIVKVVIPFFTFSNFDIEGPTLRVVLIFLCLIASPLMAGIIQGAVALQHYKYRSTKALFQKARAEDAFANAKSASDIDDMFEDWVSNFYSGTNLIPAFTTFLAVIFSLMGYRLVEHHTISQGVSYFLMSTLFLCLGYGSLLNILHTVPQGTSGFYSKIRVLSFWMGLLMFAGYWGLSSGYEGEERLGIQIANGAWLLSLQQPPTKQELLERTDVLKGTWKASGKYYKNTASTCASCVYHLATAETEALYGRVTVRDAAYMVLSVPIYLIANEGNGSRKSEDSLYLTVPEEQTSHALDILKAIEQ